MKLYQKTALVTGGGAGIGKAIALRFAKEGARLAVCDWDASRAQNVAQEIVGSGGVARAFCCDIMDADAVDAMAQQVHESLGKVEILVNSAGGAIVGGPFQRFSESTIAYMQKLVGINLMGTLYTTRAFVNDMIALRRGRILNMASIQCVTGGAGNVFYSAAKGGTILFTKSLAIELAPYGITVNAISPGAIATRPGPASLPTRLGRTGRSEEVAALALFLASEDGAFITGDNVIIDGGRVLGAMGE